jgi:putative secretion ATPase (PEP-CTERM system associated)
MYRDFYALSAKPFNLTPDPEFLYLSQGHKEALAHLTYGVESKSGFVMVTGEVGSGKTTLLRTLVRRLGSGVCLSQITNTRVSYKELLELILEDFGVPPRGLNKTGLLGALNEFLVEQFRDGKNAVLVVDEAQNLSVPTLEGLRMLSNLETEKAKLLHIILAGQPGLRDLIDAPALEQLRQRITVRYHLGPLAPGEVAEYVRHRIDKVAGDPEKAPVFPDEVMPAIHEATGGIPRLVNVLCDAALLHGYVAETRLIGPDIIGEVAAQITRDQQGNGSAPPPRPPRDAAALESRVAELEARLRAVLTGGLPGTGGAEEGLRARAVELERREAALRTREADLEERVARLKEEWKRRMARLEEERRSPRSGFEAEIPPLRVHVHDPDPRLQNALADLLAGAGIDAEVHRDYANFHKALGEEPAGTSFPVAVLGSVADDGENVLRVQTLRQQLPHVPAVFLSDIDLSTIRRRIFAAGADYFLEKPNERSRTLSSHREATEHLKNDLVRAIRHIHRQHAAVLERLRGSGERPGG